VGEGSASPLLILPPMPGSLGSSFPFSPEFLFLILFEVYFILSSVFIVVVLLLFLIFSNSVSVVINPLYSSFSFWLFS